MNKPTYKNNVTFFSYVIYAGIVDKCINFNLNLKTFNIKIMLHPLGGMKWFAASLNIINLLRYLER